MILALRLMDTDVASFVLKGHSLAARYRRHLQGHRLAVSFMTEGELYEWGLRAVWGRTDSVELRKGPAEAGRYAPMPEAVASAVRRAEPS